MNKTLQRSIIDYIFNNREMFGIHNLTTNEFKAYIYDSNDDYLIGGAQVANFISHAVRLLREDT